MHAMPRFVLNTHWHGDHTGGNENLAKEGSLLVAHDQVRARMSSDQFISFVKMAVPASPQAALPVVTFNDAVTFHLNGDEMHGTYAPHAHTDGDVFVHFRKAQRDPHGRPVLPVLSVHRHQFGRFARGPASRRWTGYWRIADDKTRIIPGHGPLANRADLVEYRNMLTTTSGRIRDTDQGRKDGGRGARCRAKCRLRREVGLGLHHGRALHAHDLRTGRERTQPRSNLIPWASGSSLE